MFNKYQKLYIVVLIICTLLLVLYTIYLSNNDCINPNSEEYKNNNKNIFILYTGGTIGMTNTPEGYIFKSGYLEVELAKITNENENISNYVIHEYQPLLNSTDITPVDWMRIGEDINHVYDKFDAFIILHGTDTMSYTASALSFMFESLSKPIIITGSVIPMSHLKNDGHNNILTSLIIASEYKIPEVIVVFDNKILRGNRSVKINSNMIGAFVSPNYPPLGIIGVNIEIDKNKLLKNPEEQMVLRKIESDKYKVVIIKLFPGIDEKYLENASKGAHGIVLETFGIGNSPSNEKFIQLLSKLIEKGVIIINVSQCLVHNVDENDYKNGKILRDIGVINGLDMTTETAFAKIYFLLSNINGENKIQIIDQLVTKSLRGELTESNTVYIKPTVKKDYNQKIENTNKQTNLYLYNGKKNNIINYGEYI
jgi:L-asparaginase